MEGYILIYRKMLNWQWYQDNNVKALFIDLLLDANFEESKKGLLTIQRGQVLTSLKRMHDRTGMTVKEIRTALDKLEKSGEIGKQTTNRNSIITINNYDEYQDKGKQRASKGQTKGNIIINNKEYKELNNIKEKIYKKEKYGLFENVRLTDEEYQKLQEKFSDYQKRIDNLSSYIASKGDKYKSHYATILNWSRKDDKEMPSWFGKEVKERERTEEDERELQELIRGY